MKYLNNYINEKLIINSNSFNKKYTYVPKTNEDLKILIKERVKDNIESPFLNDIDVSNITDFSYLFYNLTSEYIDISNWNMENALTTYSMFNNCISVRTIELPNTIKNVQNINCMFSYCKALNIISGIEDMNVSNVEFAIEAFENCRSLKHINISNWDVQKMKDMSYMFYNCINLETIGDISNWELNSIKDISSIFQNCTKLHDIGDLNKWNRYISKVNKLLCLYKCSNVKKPKWLAL